MGFGATSPTVGNVPYDLGASVPADPTAVVVPDGPPRPSLVSDITIVGDPLASDPVAPLILGGTSAVAGDDNEAPDEAPAASVDPSAVGDVSVEVCEVGSGFLPDGISDFSSSFPSGSSSVLIDSFTESESVSVIAEGTLPRRSSSFEDFSSSFSRDVQRPPDSDSLRQRRRFKCSRVSPAQESDEVTVCLGRAKSDLASKRYRERSPLSGGRHPGLPAISRSQPSPSSGRSPASTGSGSRPPWR